MPFVALCVPGHGLPMFHRVARIFGIFVAWHPFLCGACRLDDSGCPGHVGSHDDRSGGH